MNTFVNNLFRWLNKVVEQGITFLINILNPLLHAIRNNGIKFFSFWNSKENVSNNVIPKKNFLICCE